MRTMVAARSAATLAILSTLLAAGCKPAGTGAGGSEVPFDPLPPSTYVPKVKNLLTGLAATPDEVGAVQRDRTALRGLVDRWMETPEHRARMRTFFRTAFQQDQVTMDLVTSSLDIWFDIRWQDRARFERSLMDSFPRTVQALVDEGRPFTEAITTRRYMMTTAMMAVLAYADTINVGDDQDWTNRLSLGNQQRLVLDPDSPLDPVQSGAAFAPLTSGDWVWRLPVAIPDACRAQATASGDPNYLKIISDPPSAGDLFSLAFGTVYYEVGPRGGACDLGDVDIPALLTDSDWSDWRMVEIGEIPPDDTTSRTSPAFWDVPGLRSSLQLRLRTPRLGFFGTLAWDANWPTNVSNQARVTANQALIVSLGLSIIPSAALAPAPPSASDQAHATDPACAGCHATLDPYRQFFRQSWSFSYHDQTDPEVRARPAAFAIGGVTRAGTGVGDLAYILSTHPHFAIGWAQKLQFWANSTPADESDPELQRIADVFRRSGYDWKTLVREVFTSPLVTMGAATVTTAARGATLSISRRDQLCAALSNRLGIADLCALETPNPEWQRWLIRQAGMLVPGDTYYRSAELPALPTSPDLFFRSSVEVMCWQASDLLVDQDGSRYSTSAVEAALDDMVANVMGLPVSDRRAAPARQILAEHHAAALQAGAWDVYALRSTFTLACSSPTSTILGL